MKDEEIIEKQMGIETFKNLWPKWKDSPVAKDILKMIRMSREYEAVNFYITACRFQEGDYPNPTTPEEDFKAFLNWAEDRIKELRVNEE